MKPIQCIPIVLVFFILAVNLPVKSQTKVYKYTYDYSGNRTERKFIQLKSASLLGGESLSEQQEILEDELDGHEIKIYPNPTKGMLTLSISGLDNAPARVQVYSLQGSLIIDSEFTSSDNTVNLSQHPAGLYVMKVLIGDYKTEWKIVKE